MKNLSCLVVVALSLTACKKSEKKADPAPTPAGSAAAAGSAAPSGGSAAAAPASAPRNVCADITAEEASAILGGKVKIEKGETDCTMVPEDPATMVGFASAGADLKDGDLIATAKDMYKDKAKDVEIGGAKGIESLDAGQTNVWLVKGGKTLSVTLQYMNPDAAKGSEPKARALAEKLITKM